MDNPTRRLDRSELPQGRPEETRRLDTSGTSTAICLRCGQHMIETDTYTTNGTRSDIRVSVRGAKREILSGRPETVSCNSLTCLNCGYTELQAVDLQRLRELHEIELYRTGSREERLRLEEQRRKDQR